jgi:hypothetical protein
MIWSRWMRRQGTRWTTDNYRMAMATTKWRLRM